MSDPLIVRYLEGTATADEVAALNEILKKDADARAVLRAASFQALTVADLGRARAPRQEAPARWNVRSLAAAAAILLVVAGGLIWFSRPDREALRLVRQTGAVTLTGSTLTVEGANSGAEVRLADGSTLTLAGDSELAFAGKRGTDITVRRGSVTVEAAAQPKDEPMILRTPTAEAIVLGTCFTISAQTGETMVTVGAGRVRLRRLVDGASAEVAEGQMAVATLDAAAPLASRVLPPLVSTWTQTFDAAPPAGWQGEWVAADATGPGRLKNVLDVSYRRKDGTVVPAYVVSVRNPSAITTIRPDTVLRVKWRLRTPSVGGLFLISVQHSDGRFAGNFQVDLKPEAYEADPNGWRVFSAPVSTLDGRFPEGARLPTVGRVMLVFMACYSPKGELEVAEVSFR
jgi:ferric-dicitrate binding protein FerR (iron transport regulator)